MRGIEDLKKKCEKVMGKRLETPSGFDELCLRIKQSTGRNVSVSTLKRIWGYVNYDHSPRYETLSLLSAFAGYRDWFDFRNAVAMMDSSDFIGADIVKSSELLCGNQVQLRWKPDRFCVLEYLGNSEFRVLEAQNSKLNEGDILACGVMAKGEPLICHDVRRGGELLAEGYVAGKTDGIISLQIK